MTDEIISRSDAKAKGLSRYFTGKECKHGHIAIRCTINGVCTSCLINIDRRSREKNRERHRANWRKSSAKARLLNPEKYHAKDKKWRDANPHKVKEKTRRWRIENRDKYLIGEKRRRDANPEKIRLKNKKYKTENAERLSPQNIERANKWRAENPDKAKAVGRKARQHRRARLLNATGSYIQDEINALIEKQNWLCATVQCQISLRERKELDHIIAVANGGSNDITNLQYLCLRCNRKKNRKSPEEWAFTCEQMFGKELTP